jgi:hypothetical protein
MLFDSEIPPVDPSSESQAISLKPSKHLDIIGGPKVLAAKIPQLEQNQLIHFVTRGSWSSHQLISHLLQYIGPAHLILSTWSMTEDPCRALLNLKLKGQLLSAACILSERISERTPTVFQLAQNVFQPLKLAKLHAKVCLLHNDQWQVVVLGSANLTRNPKTEVGIIDTHPQSFQFHHKWMQDELAKAK